MDISVIIKALVSPEFAASISSATKSIETMARDAGAAVDGVQKRFELASRGIESAGKALVGIGAALSIGVTAPTAALATAAVKAGANIEKLTTAFTPLLGSASAANKRMAELQQFANATPFELPEVAKASRMLEVMTKGVLATGNALRMVGDVASGVGESFDDVAMWVGRLYDGLKSGRPVGEATQRLQEMGAMSGDTRNKLEDMAKAGKSFSEIWKVATDAFGRFAGGMALQAETVAGKFSTLQDSANTALAALGKSFEGETKKILDLATMLTDKLAALAQWFGELPEPVKLAALAAVAFAAAIGPIVVAFGALLMALPGLIAGWAALIPLIAATSAAIAAAALDIAAYTVVAGLMAVSIYKIVQALQAGVEWWNAYHEAEANKKSVEDATDKRLAEIAVGRADRDNLRAHGISVGQNSETSQSKASGSYSAYMASQAANDDAAREAAAKVHEEFVKTDRASLIAKENAEYEKQKKAIGGNAEALRELNALHKEALAKIDKKYGEKEPKADKDLESQYKVDNAIMEENQRKLKETDRAETKKWFQEKKELEEKDDKELERLKKTSREDARAWFAEQKRQEAEITRKQEENIKKLEERISGFANRLVGAFSSVFAPIEQVFARMQRRNQEMSSSTTKYFQGIGLAFAKMISDMAAQVLARMAVWLILKGIGMMVGGGAFGAALGKVTGSGVGGMTDFAFKSFDVGHPSLPSNMLAMVHQGEAILPPGVSAAARAGNFGPAANFLGVRQGGGSASHQASVVLDSDILSILARNGSALVKITQNQGRLAFG